MNHNVTIRHYKKQDRESLEKLAIEVQEYERSLDNTRSPGKSIVKRHVDRLLKPLETNEAIVLVAEVDGACVGYLAAKKEEDFMYTYSALSIEDLGVTPKHRGKGIGTILIKKATEVAKKKYNLDHLSIGVIANNTRVYNFYRRLGFITRKLDLYKKLK